jgi:hypothetical protein
MSIDQKYIQLVIESNFGVFPYRINNIIVLQSDLYQIFFTLNVCGCFNNHSLMVKINPEISIYLKGSKSSSNDIDQPTAIKQLGSRHSESSTNPSVTGAIFGDNSITLLGNNLDTLTVQDFKFLQNIGLINDINQLQLTTQSKTIVVLTTKNNSRLMSPSGLKMTYDIPNNISLRLIRPNAEIATIGIPVSTSGKLGSPLTITLLGSNLSQVTKDDFAFLRQDPYELNFQYINSKGVESIKFTITDIDSFANAFFKDNTITIPNEIELSFIK